MSNFPPNTIVTPEFRVNFPALFKPELMDFDGTGQGRLKFKIEALFENDQELGPLRSLAEKVAEEKWPKKNVKLKMPFLDGDEEKYDNYHGKTYMRFTSIFAPIVRDKNNRLLTDETAVYSGCWGRAIVTCIAYDRKIKKGISFFLQAFQKTRDGEPLTGISPDLLVFDDSYSSPDDDYDISF